MNKITKIFEILKSENPYPKIELKYSSNFELLIAVILSAQTTDTRVNLCTSQLFVVANTPHQILKIGINNLLKYIKSLGLYKTKAKNIMNTSKIIIDRFEGKVPNTRKDLECLSGVGRKTANVILNVAFGQPTIAIDRHIIRISNRIPLALGNNVYEIENQLMNKIPRKYLNNAHHWLILHGRYICTARQPKCHTCPIYYYCNNKR